MATSQVHSQSSPPIQKQQLRPSPRLKKYQAQSEPNALLTQNSLASHQPELLSRSRLKKDPHPSTFKLAKSFIATRSKHRQSHSTPLPVTPKTKPISDKVQKQLTKKRKREEVEKNSGGEGVGGGLKLRKHGCVSMHHVVKCKINGEKPTVLFNAKGQPYGVAASEMQSYIGVLARTKAPIWFDTWRQVPVTIKNKIWKSVMLGFDVPPSARKLVLQSANAKWKQFKSLLTCQYILPFRYEPEKLISPPDDFSFIEKNHWDIFVADRLSPQFWKIHEAYLRRVKENKYPHRLSRKGYANLEHEWSKTQTEDESEIDRSVAWVLARQDRQGNFKSESARQKAAEIESVRQQVSSGVLTEEGDDDILTKALGKPEHGGRVRGQGMHVRKAVYFNLPRSKKQKQQISIDDHVKEGVRQLLTEEVKNIVASRDAFWMGKIEKLKSEFSKKQEVSPLITSQEASCSARFKEDVSNAHMVRKNLNISFDAQLEPVREKVETDNESVAKHIVGEDAEKPIGTVREKEETQQQQGKEIDTEVLVVQEGSKITESKYEKTGLNNVVDREGQMAQLALGCVDNIVAYAKVFDFDQVGELTLHGEKLGKEYAKVSITKAIQDVEIPVPIPGEVVTTEQAVGTFVAWHRELIVLDVMPASNTMTKKLPKKNAPRRVKKPIVHDEEDCAEEFHVEFGPKYPLALKRLWLWAKEALANGIALTFQLNKDAFGVEKKLSVFLSNIHALCTRGEMAGSIITIYIHCLYEYVKKNKMLQMISFVDPSMVGTLGCGNLGERSRKLADRFKGAADGQHFLIPFNDVNHWALTVVKPNEETVYHMDPLKRRIDNGEWTDVVDNAILLYKSSLNIPHLKKKVSWENMAGIPMQKGIVDCGLFVMRYMREICHDKELQFASKWGRRGNLEYTEDDIYETKVEFAKYFMSHHAT